MDERKLQERNRTDLTRRRLSAGLCLGLLGVLSGCGGTTPIVEEASSPTEPPNTGGGSTGSAPGAAATTFGAPKAGSWDVVPTHALTLTPGTSFNLADTLPATVLPGGVFEVDRSGAPLPAGISLVPTGLLTVSSAATGTAAGVVFRYTPPA